MGIDIDVVRMLEYVVNVVILVFILNKLLYKPVSKYLKARQDKINTALDSAVQKQQEADELHKQYDALVSQSRAESAETLRKANEQASHQADQIISEAREQARQILQQAHSDVEKQMKLAREQSHDEIVSMAVSMASRILGREVSAEDNTELIKTFFEGQDKK